MNKLRVAIIGGGPSGMAAALYLYEHGIRDIRLFERHPRLGGVLPQCIHYGFGLEYFNEELTGPEFAERQLGKIHTLGIPFSVNAMVTKLDGTKIEVFSPVEGRTEYDCDAVILATGCRERTRENLEVPGTRPAGVYLAGQAQTLINLRGVRIGRRAVIQGSGDIGLIMARRLALTGCEVVGVFERLPHLSGLLRNKVQCLDHFGIPLTLNSQISSIHGRQRVEAVAVTNLESGQTETIPCDTVLFAAGLIPELDLYLQAGGRTHEGVALVNSHFESSLPHVFISGNALHINDLADNAALEGEACAKSVAAYLSENQLAVKQELPYRVSARETRYTREFFQQAQTGNAKVCIICPKSCLLSGPTEGCARGQQYFRRSAEGCFQKLTRTRVTPEGIALESTAEVDVQALPGCSFHRKLLMK